MNRNHHLQRIIVWYGVRIVRGAPLRHRRIGESHSGKSFWKLGIGPHVMTSVPYCRYVLFPLSSPLCRDSCYAFFGHDGVQGSLVLASLVIYSTQFATAQLLSMAVSLDNDCRKVLSLVVPSWLVCRATLIAVAETLRDNQGAF